MAEKITLGAHDVDVYPQRHAYLTNRLGGYVDRLAGSDLDISDAKGVFDLLGGESYDLLAVLLPQYAKRCPKYEYLGYGSEAAYEAGEYDENEDKSPTFEEIINAFEVSARVQRFDTLKILSKVFDPKLLRAWVNERMATALTQHVSSPSAQDGATPSTNSGALSPTPTESTDSPSNGSSPSSEPTHDEPQPSVTV